MKCEKCGVEFQLDPDWPEAAWCEDCADGEPVVLTQEQSDYFIRKLLASKKGDK